MREVVRNSNRSASFVRRWWGTEIKASSWLRYFFHETKNLNWRFYISCTLLSVTGCTNRSRVPRRPANESFPIFSISRLNATFPLLFLSSLSFLLYPSRSLLSPPFSLYVTPKTDSFQWKKIGKESPAWNWQENRGAESQRIHGQEFSDGSFAAKSFVTWWQKFRLQLVHRGIIGSTRRNDAADNYRYRWSTRRRAVFERDLETAQGDAQDRSWSLLPLFFSFSFNRPYAIALRVWRLQLVARNEGAHVRHNECFPPCRSVTTAITRSHKTVTPSTRIRCSLTENVIPGNCRR